MSKTNYKFSEEEFKMYNTLLISSLMKVFLVRLKEIKLINSKEEAKQIFTSDFVQDDLQDQLSKYMSEISEGAFDLDFFKSED